MIGPARESYPFREAPLLWEQDGESFRSDLGQTRSGIFLQVGLDREMVICPSGTITCRS